MTCHSQGASTELGERSWSHQITCDAILRPMQFSTEAYFFPTNGRLVGIILTCRGDEHKSIEIYVIRNSGCKITTIALRPSPVFPGCSAKSQGCACFPGAAGSKHRAQATLRIVIPRWVLSIQSGLISSSSHSRRVLVFVRFHGQSWILFPVCSFYKPKPVLMLYSQLLAQDRQEARARWGISTACRMTWRGVHI